jgi:hypothetical protein
MVSDSVAVNFFNRFNHLEEDVGQRQLIYVALSIQVLLNRELSDFRDNIGNAHKFYFLLHS